MRGGFRSRYVARNIERLLQIVTRSVNNFNRCILYLSNAYAHGCVALIVRNSSKADVANEEFESYSTVEIDISALRNVTASRFHRALDSDVIILQN